MLTTKQKIFRVLFFWISVLIGLIGALLGFVIFIIATAIMLAFVIIYIRYSVMKQKMYGKNFEVFIKKKKL